MNYGEFSNESLAMMYEAVRAALAADDALEFAGQETKLRERKIPGWRKHAANLESEMLTRGMTFNVISLA